MLLSKTAMGRFKNHYSLPVKISQSLSRSKLCYSGLWFVRDAFILMNPIYEKIISNTENIRKLYRLHEAIENTFLSCLVKLDCQLVAVYDGDGAIAEFKMENP